MNLNLTERTELNRSWSKAVLRVFDSPDTYLNQLSELAQNESMAQYATDWNGIDLQRIPKHLRQGVANMFAQFHYGETAGLLCVSRLKKLGVPHSLNKFFEIQVVEEARHVKWLSKLMQKLDCDTEVNTHSEQLMNAIHECGSAEGIVLGIHTFVEGLAHSYCLDAAQAFSKNTSLRLVSKSYRVASKVIGEWFPTLIGRDEARHIAFGTYFLKKLIPELSLAERDELEALADKLGSIIAAGALHPDLVFAPEVDGSTIGARSIARVNQQLAEIGLEARIPDVYGSNGNHKNI